MNRSLFTQYSVYIFWRRLSLWCCSVMLTLLWGGKALLGGVRSVDKTNTLLSLAGPMFVLVFKMSIMISKTWLLCKANEQRKLLPPLYFTSSWYQHLKQNESLLLWYRPITVFWSVFIGDILRCLLVHTHITDRQQQWVMEEENNIFVMITE